TDHRVNRSRRAHWQLLAQHVDRLAEQTCGRIIVGDVERGLHAAGQRAVNWRSRRDVTVVGPPTFGRDPTTLVQGDRLEGVSGKHGTNVGPRLRGPPQVPPDSGAKTASGELVMIAVDDKVQQVDRLLQLPAPRGQLGTGERGRAAPRV